jgi:hypothetical protein
MWSVQPVTQAPRREPLGTCRWPKGAAPSRTGGNPRRCREQGEHGQSLLPQDLKKLRDRLIDLALKITHSPEQVRRHR